MASADPEELARDYYRAIDADEYEDLARLLTPRFRQVRSDMSIEGRQAFVQFMRDERPETATRHEVEAVYLDGTEPATGVAVQGRLHRPDGSVGFGFVDVFECAGDRLDRLVTYTNPRVE